MFFFWHQNSRFRMIAATAPKNPPLRIIRAFGWTFSCELKQICSKILSTYRPIWVVVVVVVVVVVPFVQLDDDVGGDIKTTLQGVSMDELPRGSKGWRPKLLGQNNLEIWHGIFENREDGHPWHSPNSLNTCTMLGAKEDPQQGGFHHVFFFLAFFYQVWRV